MRPSGGRASGRPARRAWSGSAAMNAYDIAVGFAGNPLDRLSEGRADASRLAELAGAPGARAIVFVQDMPVLRLEGRPSVGPAPPRCGPLFRTGARGGSAGARRNGPGLRLAAARRRRLRRGAARRGRLHRPAPADPAGMAGPADPRPARAGQQTGAAPRRDRDARPGQGDPALSCGPSLLRPLRRADPRRRTAAGDATARPAAPCTFPAPIRWRS